MRVCVVGLGKIGLPLAAQYASKGLSVVGCDPDAGLVSEVGAGRCRLPGERGLARAIRKAVANGCLAATTETAEAVREAQVVVVIVPVGLTPDRRPDFSRFDEAAAAVARGLGRGSLVILETTVPVGTTRDRLGLALEASGLRMGSDFRLAYSPERVSVGRIFADLKRYPKIVGGIDEGSRDAAVAFYRRALDADVIAVRDAETAEFVKLAETTYRDVNIALANELAVYADSHGLDSIEAFAAANSQPYSHLHQPGVGVGGHCIPVNPHLLMDEGSPLRLPPLARELNDGMAAYGVGKLEEALGGLRGRTVLILGLAYRPNVKEAAGSSTFALARELEARGARALVHDPLFSADEVKAAGLRPAQPFPPPQVDAVLIQALHDQYRGLDLGTFAGCRVVLDGRNALSQGRAWRCLMLSLPGGFAILLPIEGRGGGYWISAAFRSVRSASSATWFLFQTSAARGPRFTTRPGRAPTQTAASTSRSVTATSTSTSQSPAAPCTPPAIARAPGFPAM